MASLDRLSGGRLLPAMGLGQPSAVEQSAFGVGARAIVPRGSTRRSDSCAGSGPRTTCPTPASGSGSRESRCGRARCSSPSRCGWVGRRRPSCVGWVGSVTGGCRRSARWTRSATGWSTITEVAATHDRTIDPEHLGVLITYSRTGGARPDAAVPGPTTTRGRPGGDRAGRPGRRSGPASRRSPRWARRSSWWRRCDDPFDPERELPDVMDALFDLQT